MPFDSISRRDFMTLSTVGVAGTLGLGASSFAGTGPDAWDPDRPLVHTGKPLTVQPILMYHVAERRPAASWKSWGGVQSDEAAGKEAAAISQELSALASRADFPMRILPVISVKTAEQTAQAHENDYDAVLVYAASGSGGLLHACFTPKKDKDTIVFVRCRSGPAYYWYEALSTRYLQTDEGEARRASRLDHGGVHIDDVVVDDYKDLLWRLRGLYALKNFLGARIVALGGPWGKYAPDAPQIARDRYGFEIIDVSYDEIASRIKAAQQDRDLVARTGRWADRYLALPNTTLETDKPFVVNAFLLYSLFKD
ncbi:MAG: hypothetical protein JW955_01200, partial [Sedimentisphaerales bacterium]|nr:hypothetical protein [Sedimentisphaerales bacterium]